MRRDRIGNERIIAFFPPASVQAGGPTATAEFDLRQGPAGAFFAGREIPTNFLLVVNMSTTVTATATLDLVVHTGDVSGALTLYATIGQMAFDTNTLWVAEVRDLQRYIEIQYTVAAATLLFGMTGNFNRSRREPIYQTANEAAVTYEKNPATG